MVHRREFGLESSRDIEPPANAEDTRRIHARGLLRRLMCALAPAILFASFSATLTCAFAEGFARISAADVNGVLLVVDGRIEFGDAPANAEAADWQFEIAGPLGYRIKNRRNHLYLAQRNGQIGLAATAADNANLIWQPTSPQGGYFQLRSRGTDQLLTVTGNTLALAPSGKSRFQTRWQEMPDFATEKLSKIEDWTKVDESERPAQLFAAAALTAAPDNHKSIELKKRWAKIFPGAPGNGPVNRGDSVVLSGKKLDNGEIPHYVAETHVRFTTGYYAAPGEEITIAVPENFLTKGAVLQIGHLVAEGVREKGALARFPYTMMKDIPIDAKAGHGPQGLRTVKLTSGFGGVIYIVGHEGFDPGQTTIRIIGGVKMPIFRLGQTNPDTWRAEIRNYPAPWAEISSHSHAITLPSSFVRTLDRPGLVAAVWEKVVRQEDEFVGFQGLRKYPHRIDTEIAFDDGVAAYNSGTVTTMPVTWLRGYFDQVDVTKPDWWGMYHEIGHGHQAPAWGAIGYTSELSNNIVLLYARHMVNPPPSGKAMDLFPDDQRSSALSEMKTVFSVSQADRRRFWSSQSVANNNYDISLPFAKLTMFAWLSDQFGWKIFIDAFANYHKPGFVMPKNTQEQHDTFLVELSRAANKDLSVYFELWGVTVTPNARRLLASLKAAGLPKWSPAPGQDIGFSFPYLLSDGGAYKIQNFNFVSPRGDAIGSFVWKRGGGKARVALQYDPACSGCARPNQIIVGLKGQPTGAVVGVAEKKPANPTRPGGSTFSDWNGTLDIPNAPGAYEVCMMRVVNSDAEAALTEAKSKKFDGCKTIGMAIVN
jgi:Peptidase M60, enhancin and enhancin-like/N-terminal domain of M60-like peptidases